MRLREEGRCSVECAFGTSQRGLPPSTSTGCVQVRPVSTVRPSDCVAARTGCPCDDSPKPAVSQAQYGTQPGMQRFESTRPPRTAPLPRPTQRPLDGEALWQETGVVPPGGETWTESIPLAEEPLPLHFTSMTADEAAGSCTGKRVLFTLSRELCQSVQNPLLPMPRLVGPLRKCHDSRTLGHLQMDSGRSTENATPPQRSDVRTATSRLWISRLPGGVVERGLLARPDSESTLSAWTGKSPPPGWSRPASVRGVRARSAPKMTAHRDGHECCNAPRTLANSGAPIPEFTSRSAGSAVLRIEEQYS